MSFNEKEFSEIVETLIKFKSGITKIPIKDTSWEELIWATLAFMYGENKVDWDPQSHEKSVDIRAKINSDDIGISAKGGVIKSGILNISSYRLTTFSTLQNKLDFIREQHTLFHFYLICARELNTKQSAVEYTVIKVSSAKLAPLEILNVKSWKTVKSGYELKKDVGFKARIVHKMSDQLWYSIPLDYFTGTEKLVRISIPVKDLGKGLIDFLKTHKSNLTDSS